MRVKPRIQEVYDPVAWAFVLGERARCFICPIKGPETRVLYFYPMNTVKVAEAAFPTEFGDFRIYGFESEDKSDSAVALVRGIPAGSDSPLART